MSIPKVRASLPNTFKRIKAALDASSDGGGDSGDDGGGSSIPAEITTGSSQTDFDPSTASVVALTTGGTKGDENIVLLDFPFISGDPDPFVNPPKNGAVVTFYLSAQTNPSDAVHVYPSALNAAIPFKDVNGTTIKTIASGGAILDYVGASISFTWWNEAWYANNIDHNQSASSTVVRDYLDPALNSPVLYSLGNPEPEPTGYSPVDPAYSFQTYTNEGATGLAIFDLPAASDHALAAYVGLAWGFYVQDADGVQINAAVGDTIRIGPSVTAAAIVGTISAFADNMGGGTTVSVASGGDPVGTVTISGTTNYNGTFTVSNVVPGVSFDINTAFVANDAAGNYRSKGSVKSTQVGSFLWLVGINATEWVATYYVGGWDVDGGPIGVSDSFDATDFGAKTFTFTNGILTGVA